MPRYPQFLGYAKPVNEMSAGYDAAFGRAKQQFELQQELEGQNALVRQAQDEGVPVTSYPELKAMQSSAKQLIDLYAPALQAAQKSKNKAMVDKIAEAVGQRNNPLLSGFYETLKSWTPTHEGNFSADFNITSDAQVEALAKQYPKILDAYGGDITQVPKGKVRVTVTEGFGEPGSEFVSWLRTPGAREPVKRSQETISSPEMLETFIGNHPEADAEKLRLAYGDMKSRGDDLVAFLENNEWTGGYRPSYRMDSESKNVLSVGREEAVKRGITDPVKQTEYALNYAKNRRVGEKVETARETTKARAEVQTAAGATLSPEALEMLTVAEQQGTPISAPNFGNRPEGVAMKAAYYNTLAEKLAESGLPLEEAIGGIGVAKAERAAATAALRTVDVNRSKSIPALANAEKAFMVALKNLDGLVDSDIPIINHGLRTAAKYVTGSTKAPAFFTSWKIAINDAATALSSLMGSNTTAQAEREKIEKMFYAGSTVKQFKSILENTLLPDIQNKRKAFQEGKDMALDDLRAIASGRRTKAKPAPKANEMPSFGSAVEAQRAFKAGEIKIGDRILVGGKPMEVSK